MKEIDLIGGADQIEEVDPVLEGKPRAVAPKVGADGRAFRWRGAE